MTDRKSSECPSETSSVSSRVPGTPANGARRSGRLPKEIAVLLIGSDTEGRSFSEQTKTVVLSRHGAGIVSTHKLAPEQELILRSLGTNKEAEMRVVGQIASQSNVYTYGVAFLDSSIDFWGVAIPPPTESEQAANRFLLECGICKSREAVDQTDLEVDVYATNEGVLRYCKSCRNSMMWKHASDPVESKPFPLEPEQKPAPAVTVAPATRIAPGHPENRRAHVRTKVNFAVCIRNPGFEDDIAVCENISRGGVCFKSRRRYYENATIEVAVPLHAGRRGYFCPCADHLCPGARGPKALPLRCRVPPNLEGPA